MSNGRTKPNLGLLGLLLGGLGGISRMNLATMFLGNKEQKRIDDDSKDKLDQALADIGALDKDRIDSVFISVVYSNPPGYCEDCNEFHNKSNSMLRLVIGGTDSLRAILLNGMDFVEEKDVQANEMRAAGIDLTAVDEFSAFSGELVGDPSRGGAIQDEIERRRKEQQNPDQDGKDDQPKTNDVHQPDHPARDRGGDDQPSAA